MVIVVMGVCGCGKTTVGIALAAALGCPFYDADGFHPPANIEKMSRKQPLTDDDRRPWLEAIAAVIRRHVAEGRPAVVGCSALTRWSRQMLGIDGREVRLVHLRGTYDLIHARLAERKGHFMPPELLKSQFATLEEPDDAVVVDVDAPPQAIVKSVLESLGGPAQS